MSFEADIRPLFTDMDVAHMKKAMDLSNRDSVFAHADAICEAVLSGHMPPPSAGEARWTAEACAKFKAWKEQRGPP